jgi:DNA-damage-inducible protein D
MKKEYIKQLFELFESACYNLNGIECWSARELQVILGYSKWVNFKNVIDKAQNSCKQAGERVQNHFADSGKMVEIGSGVEKEIQVPLPLYLKATILSINN